MCGGKPKQSNYKMITIFKVSLYIFKIDSKILGNLIKALDVCTYV